MIKSVQLIRTFSSKSNNISFLTTPIYYVNANPHIGHLYTSLIADAAQRWRRISDRGVKIEFSTGTDEHGSKIQQAAAQFKKTPSEYCDDISTQYKKLASEFGVGHTKFIRTSDQGHKETVWKFWNVLSDKRLIYQSKYEGWYCVSDETFLVETQLKENVSKDGKKVLVSLESGHPVEWTEEQNYIFKLASFRNDLLYWLNQNNVIRPKKFQKILLDFLHNEDLPDLSISRPSSRVHWGIQVPNDDSQTIYVWLDALVNYLTVAGYSTKSPEEFAKIWPPTLQVIGKDILKFHGIYWPAFLMAADLAPPSSILCHSHWTVDGEKMSKSKGNVVCPFDRGGKYSADGLRYFLLREGVAHNDGNYSDTKVIRILNSELADTLGNLLNRCTASSLNPEQIVPEIDRFTFESIASLDVTKKLIEKVASLPDICEQHYSELNFYKSIDAIIAALHSANLFFETMKPWELKNRPETLEELKVVLHITLETLRVVGILLQPIVPNICDALLTRIQVGMEDRHLGNLAVLSWSDTNFRLRKLAGEKAVLFRKIVTEEGKKHVARKSLKKV
ncbi:methionine--tRNA ligase, mitochondrial isoform X1 [Aethina tumida]|uniref:methionine--tRNA ligase, mitochondrial isoform X1 n=1 Tax=Aethina tumida TaxID=116153 RepID=UPI0021475409|nr:methionine--tRNA ligase, mitochondrial isoform X1 [Aethina tumida]